MNSFDVFPSSPAISAARRLSDRLLSLETRLLRRYSLPEDPTVTFLDRQLRATRSVDNKSVVNRQCPDDSVATPLAPLLGIYGVGFRAHGDENVPFVLCDAAIAPREPRFLGDLGTLQRFLSWLLAEDVSSAILAAGVTPPVPHYGPGDAIDCAFGGSAAISGTLGALVRSSTTGRDCVLTAGHVGGQVGSTVVSAGVSVGAVTFVEDPASQPALRLAADIAVIELDGTAVSSLRTDLASTGVMITGSTVATALSKVTSYTVRGKRPGQVIGRLIWLGSPAISGLWADVAMTNPISDPNDSGAPVLLTGSNLIVGHIVSGSAGFASYVQDIQYQLTSANCTLR